VGLAVSRLLKLAQLVDGITHGIEAGLAVAEAQRTRGLEVDIDLFNNALGYCRPLLKASIELLDQRQCLRTVLHGRVLFASGHKLA